MGFRLKDFREAHKMFQSEMAELLQLNQSSLSRKELKPSVKLNYLQMKLLVDKFGKEDVEAFMVDDNDVSGVSVIASGNTNNGEGTQNNGLFGADTISMTIIKQQSEALTRLAEKQAEQTDRLIVMLEKIAEKI